MSSVQEQAPRKSGELTSGQTPDTQRENTEDNEKEAAAVSQNVTVANDSNINAGTINRERKNATYVGWKQIGRWTERDRLTLDDELLDFKRDTFLNSIIPDKFYGDWYHFVAIIFLGGILSFGIGYFKFSMAPVFFVIVLTSVLFRTNSKKYRASIRELIQKELTVQKIENDYETMEWLNTLLDKYWPIIEPSVSQMVVAQVNEVLATNEAIPAFVKAVWLDKFTLGVKPPRIESVKTFMGTPTDVVVMDWIVTFTPHDLSDMTAKLLRNYINQRVLVKAKLFGITASVAVNKIAFKSRARVRFKLMNAFPHIETVNVQLLDVPDFDFESRLFGETVFNWEIMGIPGLYSLIQKLARTYMFPMLLPPFSFQLNIPKLLSDSNLSIGVLEVTIKNARHLRRAETIVSTSVDPYLTLEFSGKVVGKTRTVRDTLNPIWNEVIYVLLPSFTDPLTFTVYDKRVKIKDKVLGRIEYNLSSLHDNNLLKNQTASFLRNSKPVGDLNFDLRFFPTLRSKKLPNGTIEEMPDLNTGIAGVKIDKLTGLVEANKNDSFYIDLFLNGKKVLTTGSKSGTESASFGSSFEGIITDRRRARFRVLVRDAKTKEVLGSTVQSLNDLIDRTQVDRELVPLEGCKWQLKLVTHWRPVRLDIGSPSATYNPPIGALRIFISKGNDLRNLEKIGKIDPYVRILVNGQVKDRTAYQKDTLDPVWNETIYVILSSPNQKVTLQVMDVESIEKDREVGHFDINFMDMCQKNEQDRYIEDVEEKPRVGRLITKKGVIGNVTYNVSFYPVLPVLTLEETRDYERVQRRMTKLKAQQESSKQKELTPDAKERLDNEILEVEELNHMYSRKAKLDLDQLTNYNSGALAITVLSGELPQGNVYIQAFFDGSGHPRFTSPKIVSRVVNNPFTGDVTIKELDRSLTTFRVSKKANANKLESCLSEVTIPTMDLVRHCYYKPSILNLAGESAAKLMVRVTWFPLDVKSLPQADLLENSGDLTIISKSAEGLMSSDANGFSDPYLKFYINGWRDDLHKTIVKKKTLNPVWNDKGTITVHNRMNDVLCIKVMDWDAATTDDIIGRAQVPLSEIKPDGTTSLDIPVRTDEGGDGGVLHIDFTFSPRYVINAVKREIKVGDAASKGLGTGIKAGTTVVSAGFGKINKIRKGVFSRRKSSKSVKSGGSSDDSD